MMSLTFGLFTQVSGSGPLGPLVYAHGKFGVHGRFGIYWISRNNRPRYIGSTVYYHDTLQL